MNARTTGTLHIIAVNAEARRVRTKPALTAKSD